MTKVFLKDRSGPSQNWNERRNDKQPRLHKLTKVCGETINIQGRLERFIQLSRSFLCRWSVHDKQHAQAPFIFYINGLRWGLDNADLHICKIHGRTHTAPKATFSWTISFSAIRYTHRPINLPLSINMFANRRLFAQQIYIQRHWYSFEVSLAQTRCCLTFVLTPHPLRRQMLNHNTKRCSAAKWSRRVSAQKDAWDHGDKTKAVDA